MTTIGLRLKRDLRAIELAPSDAVTHSNYGYMLLWQARFDQTERELKLVQQLDPLFPFNYVAMGMFLKLAETTQRLWSNAERRWRSIPPAGPPTAIVSVELRPDGKSRPGVESV